jgi:hypothetical protein
MANSTSIILYPSDRRQLLLAESAEQSLQVSRCASGPGRILDEIYTAAGLLVGKSANRVAHHLGLSPCAVARRICAFFGGGREREEKLEKLSTLSDDRKLKMDCVKLMGYALPYVFSTLLSLGLTNLCTPQVRIVPNSTPGFQEHYYVDDQVPGN